MVSEAILEKLEPMELACLNQSLSLDWVGYRLTRVTLVAATIT